MNIIKKTIALIKRLLNTVQFFIKNDDCLLINSCMCCHCDKVNHKNFGDDLNYYLLKELTGKRIVNYSEILPLPITNFMAIGSTIDWLTNRNSVIWGSGIIDFNGKIPHKPKRVMSVRGALTRNILITNDINCPKSYGDPALLLPKIITSSKKKYKFGLIPHVMDLENPAIVAFLSDYNGIAELIDFEHYTNWKKIIQQITECDTIISSSLHGIIISDAYNIPNVWVRFSNKITGGNFKYHDYFSSVNRPLIEPEIVEDNITEEIINRGLLKYVKPEIDIEQIINSCPFQINIS